MSAENVAPAWGVSGPAPARYKPISGLAAWVRALLAAGGIAGVPSIAALIFTLVFSFRSPAQRVLDPTGFDWATGLSIAMLSVRAAMALVTAVVFLIWLRRGYRNLIAMRTPGLRHRPGWAVGAWFVPIMNFGRPIEIVNDTWRASDPELPAGDARWYLLRPPWWHAWWWACFLGYALSGWVAGRIPDETPAGFRTVFALILLGEVFSLPAALLCMRVVSDVTRRQRQRAVRLARDELLPREFAVAGAT